MQVCIKCTEPTPLQNNKCSNCNYEPERQNGILIFSPGLVASEEHFPEAGFADLFQLEEAHFWFRARNELIIWAMQKFAANCKDFLEIGCGTGYVISGIRKQFPGITLRGSELSANGLQFAAKRLPDVKLYQMDARQIPFREEFDAIGIFDVLEHIPEDEQVLQQIFTALKPGGKLVLTVPQYKELWTVADDYACHVRRYSKKELQQKIERSGFELLYLGSFVALLMPILIASRLNTKNKTLAEYDPLQEFRIPKLIGVLLEVVMTIERSLIKMGIRFPAGGSLLCVARKNSSNAPN